MGFTTRQSDFFGSLDFRMIFWYYSFLITIDKFSKRLPNDIFMAYEADNCTFYLLSRIKELNGIRILLAMGVVGVALANCWR